MKTIALFNNKGGVGKTSLVYHLTWMYAELGVAVVAADLDPQANLTSMFVDEDSLEGLWTAGPQPRTVYGAIKPLLDGIGDIATPHVQRITEQIGLLVGDLTLSAFEDELNSQWPRAISGETRAFRVLSAFWRIIQQAAQERDAALVLIDVGPNLGAINRAALINAEHVVIPLASDLYSLQGLKNLGPTLRRWKKEWAERRVRNPAPDISLPSGTMQSVGYIVMQHAVRLDRPVKAYDRWMARIPGVYREAVLNKSSAASSLSVANDPHCLAALKHYRSLMPLAQEARKPMFFLKPADGAIGGHAQAVSDCYTDFRTLARVIARKTGMHVG